MKQGGNCRGPNDIMKEKYYAWREGILQRRGNCSLIEIQKTVMDQTYE